MAGIATLLLTFCLWLSAPGFAGAQVIEALRTESGPVRGAVSGETIQYLGIPYAASPVGDLRWRPPQAAAQWRSVRDATKFGSNCPQTSAVGEFAAPSADEDCLYLNVIVPKRARTGRPLAVMFWIPGGGLFAGGSSHYDATRLVVEGNVIVVSVNYRVGVLGFFAHPDIEAEARGFTNFGLLDQQFALRWVRNNIAAFNGDPNNVTLFGESAGAVSIYGHMASEQSTRLFHKAILQSGLTTIPKPNLVLPLVEARSLGRKFATAMGCNENAAACLRRLPVQKLIDEQMPFLAGLIVGGTTVPEPLETAFRAGRFNRVPVINGTNHDEWRWPLARTELRSRKPLLAEQYPAALLDFFGDIGSRVEREYSLGGFESPSQAYAAAQTDAYFACSAFRNNGYLSRQVPVYGYEFNDATAPMYMPPASFPYGAAHTVELQFLFRDFHGGSGKVRTLNETEAELAKTMVRYWTNFAKSADPNGSGPPFWPRFDADRPLVLSLDLPRPTPLASFGADHRCEFWNGVLP